MPYKPIVPEGAHLGTSRNVEGAVTGHLFDDETNELIGHAAWEWVDDSSSEDPLANGDEGPPEVTGEQQEWAEVLAAFIVAGTATAIITGSPHIKRWWIGKASPFLRSAWECVATLASKTSTRTETVTPSVAPSRELVTTARALERSVVESKIKMRSSEWEHRFRAMLAAGAFKDEQLRILTSAKIEDDHTLDPKKSSPRLTSQQFVDRIRLMFEANPLLLDEETSAELIRVFGAPMRAVRTREEISSAATQPVAPYTNIEAPNHMSNRPRALGDA